MARAIGLAVAATSLVGCYTLQPTFGGTPQLGSRVALDVNDAGRVALGGSMGPEIDQIEGRLVQHDTSDYLVAVSAIHLLRGGDQVWTGEQVHVKSAYISRTYERHFSPARTAALSALGVGAVAAFVAQSLVGSGDDPNGENVDTSHTNRVPVGGRRIPLRLRVQFSPHFSWP